MEAAAPQRRGQAEAEAYIRRIKQEASEQLPVRNYETQPLVNALTLDCAEQLLDEEVARMMRQMIGEFFCISIQRYELACFLNCLCTFVRFRTILLICLSVCL